MNFSFPGSLSLAIAATAIGVLVGLSQAQAQMPQKIEARVNSAVQKLQAACSEDLKKYCSTVTPGEGRLLLCLEAHEDKISTKCDYALYDASQKLERALDRIEQTADACWSDIEKYCATIPEGGGRIAQCLVGKKASLKAACKKAIGNLQAAK